MNKIEQGIEGSSSSPFIINGVESYDEQAGNTIALDKTWHEISEKFLSVRICLITLSDSSTMVMGISVPSGTFINKYGVQDGSNTFYTADEFGYPSAGGGSNPR